MIDSPECAVCGSRQWESLGRRVFRASDTTRADDYARKRLRVLFEVWFPGAREAVLDFVLCRYCGFVAFTPRPDEEDLARKYRFLAEHGDSGYAPDLGDDGEDRRARQLFRTLAPLLRRGRSRILDYGGGNGRLVMPFVARGDDVCVVDYHPAPLPGVCRLASTLDGLPAGLPFDAIVCSHLLEHLADPGFALDRLRAFLSEEGVAYFEVPVEIWKGPPRMAEPVTHINFFTRSTLLLLLERCGYRVFRSGVSLHPDRRRRTTVAFALARRGAAGRRPDVRRGIAETRRLLHPSVAMRWRHAGLRLEDLPRAAWRFVVAHRFNGG